MHYLPKNLFASNKMYSCVKLKPRVTPTPTPSSSTSTSSFPKAMKIPSNENQWKPKERENYHSEKLCHFLRWAMNCLTMEMILVSFSSLLFYLVDNKKRFKRGNFGGTWLCLLWPTTKITTFIADICTRFHNDKWLAFLFSQYKIRKIPRRGNGWYWELHLKYD